MKRRSLLRTLYKVDVLWLIRKWKAWRRSKLSQADAIKKLKEIDEHVHKLIEKRERRNGRINR